MRTNQFFLQMSGVPGSGKTTVASAIAQATNSVILDHDLSKSALLDADVPVERAGPASYKVLQKLAVDLLTQEQSVIFDSPCLYIEQLEFGKQLAEAKKIPYLYIECVTKDLDEIDRRLKARSNHRSQLTSVRGKPSLGSGKDLISEAVFLDWMQNMKRPADYLQLDTSLPIETYTQTAVDYVMHMIK